MRKYQPIWEALKRDKKASIVAPIESHKRIIKAVIKEKNIDEGYKLLLAEEGYKATLTNSPPNEKNKKVLSFSLVVTLKISCIGAHNL